MDAGQIIGSGMAECIERGKMARLKTTTLAALALTCGVSFGCAEMQLDGSSTMTGANGAKTPQAEQQTVYRQLTAQFNDLPIPKDFTMDVERTIVLGPQDAWVGRLVMQSPHDSSTMFDFFKDEMPGLGWHELTAVRAINSVLTFSRLGRIATVQIHGTRGKGSDIVVTASPERPPQVPGQMPTAGTAQPRTLSR